MTEQEKIFSHKPQINISWSSTGRMWLIASIAFLCILQSSLSDNFISLIPAATALVSALILELLLTGKKYGLSKIKDGSAAATALILTLMLPNNVHPVFVVFGVAFAIVIIKYSFGGLGANWFNPALAGWLFIRFSWPSVFSGSSGIAAVSVTEMPVTINISPLGSSITEFLNNSIFSLAGVQLPAGYIDLLFLSDSGIIADRGLLFLLIGTIFITAAKINRGWIPLVFLSVYGYLVYFAGDLSGVFWDGDILYGFFSGGTILAAFIITAEPSSGAKSKTGVLITVILTAVLSWVFRFLGSEYLGCFLAIALVNCFTPVIRLLEDKILLSKMSQSKNKESNA